MSNQGGFSEEAFEKYQRLLSVQGEVEFSEGETYDFTRCMRPDGSFYGTRGKCKKGSETGAKEAEAPKTAGGKKRRAAAEGKAAAKEAVKKAAGAKRSATAARANLLKEELEKVKDKMRGASPEVQNRLLQEASKKADERIRAGTEAKPATRDEKVNALRDKVSGLKASGDKKKLAAARGDLQGQERMRKIESQAKKEGKTPDDVIRERNAAADKKVKAKLEPELLKRLQDRASRGDKEAMRALKEMRAKGEIGKEPGFAPGQKARNEAKEVANVKAGKSPVADVKPARKPRATTAETKPAWQEAEKAVIAAKVKFRAAEKETKGDQSVEARQRRLEAGRELDKAERAAEKASKKYFAAAGRESRAAMTPEQRKEEREWNRFKKQYG